MPPVRMDYEFFEHTADIGVRIYGDSLEALFRNAARALYETLGRFAVRPERTERRLTLHANTREHLLHDWLAELLYDLETQQTYYDHLEIAQVGEGSLTATLAGGTIDFDRSQTHEEIKAVTYHQLDLQQVPDGTWRATVIFDV